MCELYCGQDVKKLAAPAVAFARAHPYLACWIVLAVGMVIMLLASSTQAGLLPSQLAFLAVMTVLLAGACVWIISWDSDEDEAEESA